MTTMTRRAGRRRVTSTPRSDESLLQDYVQSGDTQALQTLIERHWERAWRLAWRSLGDRSLAEDVAQEAFVRLSRQAHRFEPGRALGPWLTTLVLNAARDAGRRRERQRRRDEVGGARMQAQASKSREQQAVEAALPRHVATLSLALREAIVLRYFDGRSLEETAEALGCPVGTVSSRVRRGLERLKASLEREGLTLAPSAVPAGLTALAGVRGQVPAAPAVGLIEELARQAPRWAAPVGLGAAAATSAVLGVMGLALVALFPRDPSPADVAAIVTAAGGSAPQALRPDPADGSTGAGLEGSGAVARADAPRRATPSAGDTDTGAGDTAAAAEVGQAPAGLQPELGDGPAALLERARRAWRAGDHAVYARCLDDESQAHFSEWLLGLVHMGTAPGGDPAAEGRLATLLVAHGLREAHPAPPPGTWILPLEDRAYDLSDFLARLRVDRALRERLIDALVAQQGRFGGYRVAGFVQPHSWVLARLKRLAWLHAPAEAVARVEWERGTKPTPPLGREQDLTFVRRDGEWRLRFLDHPRPAVPLLGARQVLPPRPPEPPPVLLEGLPLVPFRHARLGFSLLAPVGSEVKEASEQDVFLRVPRCRSDVGVSARNLAPTAEAFVTQLRAVIGQGEGEQTITTREVPQGYLVERVSEGGAAVVYLQRTGLSGRSLRVRVLTDRAGLARAHEIVASFQVD